MTVADLIKELCRLPQNSPVYFCGDLRSNEARPITELALGDDETGEAVFLATTN